MPHRHLAFALVAALAIGSLGACSSDSDGASSDTTTTTEAPVEPLQILVSNDDGYEGDGISALVEGLTAMDDVEVTVVAPLEDRTGTGGTESEGELAVTDVALDSGYAAKAVDGYPADTIRVAVDELGIEPDLVVSGINAGQNLGPVVDLSGTVGAARAAVARGIPALATSQGTPDFDYAAAVPLIVEWVEARRGALLAGDEPVEVTNVNIPSCSEGELRGTLEIEADLDGDAGKSLQAQDCTSTAAEDSFDGDVAAFLAGFATISVIPSEPAEG